MSASTAAENTDTRGGWVSLVGAGPGDPDLITVRGRDRLAQADVVVYDDLAGRDLLAHCRQDCERIFVGKRCGSHHASQDRIHRILIEQARLGRRVVRLKGGDPFVFGRGGEELEALARAGLPVEVVPGVTAAVAAGAASGVPLTHRELASAVVFLTGHEDPAKPGSAIDWAALASLRATLCVYMGARRLPGIASCLIAAGMAPGTPVAVISGASRPDQRVERLDLAEVLARPDPEAFSSPALAIIGAVAAFPDRVRELAGAAYSGALSSP